MSLSGKTALVTGSTSGIGLGVAKAMAAQGAHIMINGFGDAEAIETERAGLEKDYGIKARYSGADLTKPAEIETMIKACEELGGVDVLVNNAGIQHVAPIEDFPPEKWDAIIGLNLTASFHTVRLSFAAMKAKKWGRIINIASAHALVASPFKSAYVSAKHGLLGFTRTIALEGAEFGVTCNAICPGYVHTPLVDKQIPDTMTRAI
jgi:3-hydroxybutyrate dehydrogenase